MVRLGPLKSNVYEILLDNMVIVPLAKARESINSRLKLFGILQQTFRHNVEKHGIVMGAVANISQIIIEEESPLFQLDYYDGYNYRRTI